MVTVKNRKPQPYVVNVPNKSAIYFNARETKTISDEDFKAPELQEQLNNRNFVVLRMTGNE
ncbi:hypothetical protein D1872_130100 [compost metagenome]